MAELQLALELIAACLGGFFVGVVFMRKQITNLHTTLGTLTLYDHDGVRATVQPSEAGHWLLKGFVREWIAPPAEGEL